MSTPKSQIGINYAKLRRSNKHEQNHSSVEKQESRNSQKAKYFGLFDEMNQDNLNYIEDLIKKSNNKLNSDNKRNHQRAKSTMEEKKLTSTNESQISQRYTISNKEALENITNTQNRQNQQKAPIGNYFKQEKPTNSKENSKTNNIILCKVIEGEKLFDQFFKSNHSNSFCDSQKENNNPFNQQKIYHSIPLNKPVKCTDSKKDRKQIEDHKQPQGFMDFLDYSINYLDQSKCDLKTSDQKNYKVPLQKQISQEYYKVITGLKRKPLVKDVSLKNLVGTLRSDYRKKYYLRRNVDDKTKVGVIETNNQGSKQLHPNTQTII